MADAASISERNATPREQDDLSRMPKPPDHQSGLQNPPTNSRELQALLSHPLRHPYRPHLIPTPSQTPVHLIQNLATGDDPVKKSINRNIRGSKSPSTSPSASTRALENGEIRNERWNEFSKATHAPEW